MSTDEWSYAVNGMRFPADGPSVPVRTMLRAAWTGRAIEHDPAQHGYALHPDGSPDGVQFDVGDSVDLREHKVFRAVPMLAAPVGTPWSYTINGKPFAADGPVVAVQTMLELAWTGRAIGHNPSKVGYVLRPRGAAENVQFQSGDSVDLREYKDFRAVAQRGAPFTAA